MEIQKVWAVWFSATDTTSRVVSAAAKMISQLLHAEYDEYDFTLPQARTQELAFQKSDLVVLGVPVYAGRVPNLLMPYIRDSIRGDGTLAVPVVLFGNRAFDDGLIELRNLMYDNGFCPITAGAFVGEHSFSRTLGAGRPDEEDMLLVKELAEHTADLVQSLSECPDRPVIVDGNEEIRPYYTPKDSSGKPSGFLKVKPETDTEKCVRCGLCAKVCPMGAIDSQNVSLVPGKCIKCCACVKKCPTGAKYFAAEAFLYHKQELEEKFAGQRAESKIFL